ncbi:hypothetical protein ACLKA6_009303 [Drosophila palustris]
MIESLCTFLLLLIAKVSANCQLDAGQISGTNRIFAVRSGSQLYPLRVDVVPTHQTLDMICDSQNVVQVTCQQTGQFAPQLPLADCSNPIKATVEAIVDNTCSYTMYRVGYKLSQEVFLELYRSCYDPSTQTAHFVLYQAYPHNLGSRPDQAFTTDGVITGADAASFQAKNIYQRFEELLGPQQSYISSARDLVFDRGHLAPSAIFGFEQYQRITFKYINAVPQFAGNNRGNWKVNENWVQKQLSDGNFAEFKICTGALDVLQLKDTSGQLKSIYLNGDYGNPVPKWLWKIVNDGAGSRFAFLTYNNIYDTVAPTPICQQIPCPSSLTFNPDPNMGSSFCCDPSDFITRNIPHLTNVC